MDSVQDAARCVTPGVHYTVEKGIGPSYAAVLSLRVSCLGAGGGLGGLAGDASVSTRHVLAWANGQLVGVSSLLENAAPFSDDFMWRLRALAVNPAWRGRGIARSLTHRRLELCAPSSAWVVARVGVSADLHRKLGARALEVAPPGDSWSSGEMMVLVHGNHPG